MKPPKAPVRTVFAPPSIGTLPIRLQYPPAWDRALSVQMERQRIRLFIEPRLTCQMLVRVRLSDTPEVRAVLAEALSVRINGVISEAHRIRGCSKNRGGVSV